LVKTGFSNTAKTASIIAIIEAVFVGKNQARMQKEEV